MKRKIGIILGSGLNKFSKELYSPQLIYEDNNSFHNIEIVSGIINGNEVVLFSGRRHYYEGYPENKILFNVNMAVEMGLNFLIITNAAGGINKNFRVSDLMLITSHLNFQQKAILSKKNLVLYPKDTLNAVKNLSKKEKIILRTGSYCCNSGPNYETKSEIRFLSKLGIDAVGMSTVPEILHANRSGIKTIGLSCITNILSEQSAGETRHEEVLEAGNNSFDNFSRLLKEIISLSN